MKNEWLAKQLERFLPSDPAAAMKEVFERLQSELPTPSIVLVGEPQVGKSSTVRVLTGDPSAKIGFGDGVPVTEHIEAYTFPKDSELPLWTFLDTPGVGTRDPDLEAADFAALMKGESQTGERIGPPHLLLACVRIDDQALHILPWLERWEELHQEEGRRLPWLVVQTCLHRLVHPHPEPYPFGERGDGLPEQLPDLALDAILKQREALRKIRPDIGFVVVDFTDPEDEVGDPLYGADALLEALFEQLPDAIVQMMRSEREAFDDIFEAQAHRLIWSYSVVAAGAGAIPPPFGDIGTLAVALAMLRQLAAQYRQPWEFRTVLDLMWSLGSTTLLWLAARYFIRRIPIPVLMAPVGAAGAFSLVFSLGQLMAWYYAKVREGHQPNAEDVKLHWDQAQQQSKQRWKDALSSIWSQHKGDEEPN